MKTHLLGLMGAVMVAAALSACKEDPTKSLAGSPSSVIVSLNPISVDETDTTERVTASVVDQSLSPLPAPVTASSAVQTVATVVPDTSAPDPTGTHSFFTVTGRQLGATTITFSGAGLSTNVSAYVLPSAVRGAASSRTPKGGDTVTLHATTLVKFDPATARFAFPGNQRGVLLAASAESLRALMPYLGSNFGTDSVSGVVVTYVPGLELTIPIAPNIVQTGDRWAGDSLWQTAPDITPLLPASGDSAKMIVGIEVTLAQRFGALRNLAFDTLTNNRHICPEFLVSPKRSRLAPKPKSSGPCMIFKFTLAAPTTLNFTTAWLSGNADGTNPDIDIYACSDSTVANFATACPDAKNATAGASTALVDPVSIGNRLYPAGTTYFVIEYFAACNESRATRCGNNGQQSNYFVTIARP